VKSKTQVPFEIGYVCDGDVKYLDASGHGLTLSPFQFCGAAYTVLPHLYTDARLNDSDFDKEDYITSFVRGLARERLFSEAGL